MAMSAAPKGAALFRGLMMKISSDMRALALCVGFFVAGSFCRAEGAEDGAGTRDEAAFRFEAGGTSLIGLSLSGAEGSIAGGNAVLLPRFTAGLGAFDLVCSPRFVVNTDCGADVALDELALTAAAGPVSFRLGRFAYRPGAAAFLSTVDYFSPVDYGRSIEEGNAIVGRPDILAQARFACGNLFATASFAPFRPVLGLEPVSSPWFSRKGIKESLLLATGDSDTLRTLSWADGVADNPFIPDLATSLEAGYANEWLRIGLSGFYGADREPGRTSTLTYSFSEANRYDIALSPIRAPMARVGALAAATIGPFDVRADGSWFDGKGLEFGSLYSAADGYETVAYAVSGIDYTVGFSWRLPFNQCRLSAEWRNTWYEDSVDGAVFPFLHRAAAAEAVIPLSSLPLTISATGLLSLEDGSSFIAPALTLQVGPTSAITARWLCFAGKTDTELGEFSDSNRFTFSYRSELQGR